MDTALRAQWRPWHPERDGYRGLAPFVSTEALWSLGLRDDSLHDGQPAVGPKQRREAVQRLYDKLRERHFPYSRPAWRADSSQLIRDARLIDRTAATCLDIAVMFAAMCKAAGLRPYLVVLEGLPGGADHAMVLVRLDCGNDGVVGQRGDMQALREAPARPAGSFDPVDGDDGVFQFSGDVFDAQRLDEQRCVVVDVTMACGHARDGEAFDAACKKGCDQLVHSSYEFAAVVDVVYLHAAYPEELGEFGAVREESRPAIYRLLPPRSAFTFYPSRRRIRADLAGATGVVVLRGAQGTGKSMLARQVAAEAGEGCGWFLDAFDARTLTASLAEAESYERGVVLASVDGAARKPFADLARRRLHEAPGPWVVVLDNVDVAPGQLGDRPQPKAELSQLLIVTTTREDWTLSGARVVELDRIDDDEVRTDLDLRPGAPVAALDGRPLLVAASSRFRRATGHHWWERVADSGDLTVDQIPAHFWSVAEAQLTNDDNGARLLAAVIAWLPPTALWIDVLDTIVSRVAGEQFAAAGSLHRAVGCLADIGLVESAGGRVTMHRLFRQAVTADSCVRDKAATANFVAELLDGLRASLQSGKVPDLVVDPAEVETFGMLVEHASDREAVVGLHALASLVERQDDDAAARWFPMTLARLEEFEDSITAPDMRLIAVNCLRGMARAVFRGARTAAVFGDLGTAIAWTERAARLCEDVLDHDLAVARSRVDALRGLLIRKQANDKTRPQEERLHLGKLASEILRRSAAERRHLFKGRDDSPDFDRSQYNLAGLEVVLAQLEPEKAVVHLDRAWAVYEEVLHQRETRYRTRQLEEVACCINGLALVDYYRTVLLPAPLPDKVRLLHQATVHANEAIQLRQELAGPLDGHNTAKSLALLAKIALARLAVHQATGGKHDSDAATIADFGEERARLVKIEDADSGARVGPGSVGFEPVPQIGTGVDLISDIAAWVSSKPLRALITAFGGDAHMIEKPGVDLTAWLGERLAWLDEFTDRWDSRVGQERNLASELELTSQQVELVRPATIALGMHFGPLPRTAEYDHVFLLGGLVRACLTRPAYAAYLVQQGLVKPGAVTALGGFRKFKGDEFELAARSGLADVTEEFQALDMGTRRAFGLGEAEQVDGQDSDLIGGTWRVKGYRTATGVPVQVVAALSTEPATRRANTPDSYLFFAQRLAQLKPAQRLLMITSPIYVPAQHADALRMLALPYRVTIETVGHDPSLVPPELHQSFTPSKYLQEVRSAIRSLRQLVVAAQ